MGVMLRTNWWLLLISGVTALILGVLTVIRRDITASELAYIFLGYAMIDAAANAAGSISAAQKREPWLFLSLRAAVGFAAALLILLLQGLSLMGLIYIIAAWAFVTGVLSIIAAARVRGRLRGKWLLAVSGMTSIALGLVMATAPLAGPSDIAFWLAVYAFLFGALIVTLALRVRNAVETRRGEETRAAA